MKFAASYYVKDSEKGKECVEIRLALRPLLKLYTNEKARNFGPLALKAVRQCMVESDLSRGVVNRRVNKIKRMFKWAVSEELVPSSVYEALRTVTGLLYGRTTASLYQRRYDQQLVFISGVTMWNSIFATSR